MESEYAKHQRWLDKLVARAMARRLVARLKGMSALRTLLKVPAKKGRRPGGGVRGRYTMA